MKTHLHFSIIPTPSHQEGAVLITSLILLVIITMLGVSAIEATKLETRMAANTREYNLAFQIAQSGIDHTFRTYEEQPEMLSGMPDDKWLSKPPEAKTKEFESINIGSGTARFRVMKSSKQVDYGSKVSRYFIIESTGCTKKNCNNGVKAVIVGGMETEQAKDPEVLQKRGEDESQLPIECETAPSSAGCLGAIKKVCSTSFSPNKCRIDLEEERQNKL
ncbi:MAG: pilus assembly PilX N-terminal domain-containing protein [Candidatus Parabeggiatoa sp.]|nr:pilus assembly PilX N-terminal domain-containing protein [Candidatus Parabeggiatoa sp.]